MLSLFFRNLIFTVLQPGLVAGLIPYFILGDRINSVFIESFAFLHYSGVLVFIIGFVIMLTCIISFAVKGRGTLSPADPTKKLVITGFYQYSRNPMYIGVMLILIGESIFFQSLDLMIYSMLLFAGFHLFTVLVEEPRLRRDFKEQYEAYCVRVRRWM